jgi:hypothetical protein
MKGRNIVLGWDLIVCGYSSKLIPLPCVHAVSAKAKRTEPNDYLGQVFMKQHHLVMLLWLGVYIVESRQKHPPLLEWKTRPRCSQVSLSLSVVHERSVKHAIALAVYALTFSAICHSAE